MTYLRFYSTSLARQSAVVLACTGAFSREISLNTKFKGMVFSFGASVLSCERRSEYNTGKNVHPETTVSLCLSLEEVLLLDKSVMLSKVYWAIGKYHYYYTYFTDAVNESHASV